MRPSSLILAASLVFAPVAAATGADDAKVDFKVTAEELAREFKTDSKTAAAKYKGKSVEITGTVWATRHDQESILLNGFKQKPTDVVGELAYVNVTGESRSKIRGLAKGQKITARGVMEGSSVPSVNKCEVVKVGPSTAIPATFEKLDAEYKRDKASFNKKYAESQFVLKVKVVAVVEKNKLVVWTVTEPGKKNGAKFELNSGGFLSEDLYAEHKKVKAGDEILVFASFDPLNSDKTVVLGDAVHLRELPEGMKLPSAKK